MRRRWPLLAVVLAIGCNIERSAPPESHKQAPVAEQPMLYGSQASNGIVPVRAYQAAVALAETGLPMPPREVTNMIIRTATASVQVDSVPVAIAQVKQLAARVGGYVANSKVETGTSQLRQADIEVKIPAARFEEALSGLNPIGRLESVNVEAEDVGEEFVDVGARMENARRLERRLIDLLATRTGKLKDVLDVEQSLARVREEIERYQGRIRYLQAHTSMSTLTITVHEPVPVVGTAGKSVMGEAFAQAWRNLVAFVAFLIQALGIVLPLGLVAAPVWFLTRRLKVRSPRAA